MWNPNVRPYGEYFAKAQAVTTADVAGNVAANNPMRLDAAQSGTAIRVAVPLNATLAIAAGESVELSVYAAKTATGTMIKIGTALYNNDTGATYTFGPDGTLMEFVLPQILLVYPYIKVMVKGSAAPVGTIDIFPHYVSAPRR